MFSRSAIVHRPDKIRERHGTLKGRGPCFLLRFRRYAWEDDCRELILAGWTKACRSSGTSIIFSVIVTVKHFSGATLEYFWT